MKWFEPQRTREWKVIDEDEDTKYIVIPDAVAKWSELTDHLQDVSYIEKEVRKPAYCVGDSVRIRSWEDMAAKYGTSADGSTIQIPFTFTSQMRDFCLKTYVVDGIQESGFFGTICYSLNGIDDCWAISEEMLEPAPHENYPEIDIDETIAILKA